MKRFVTRVAALAFCAAATAQHSSAQTQSAAYYNPKAPIASRSMQEARSAQPVERGFPEERQYHDGPYAEGEIVEGYGPGEYGGPIYGEFGPGGIYGDGCCGGHGAGCCDPYGGYGIGGGSGLDFLSSMVGLGPSSGRIYVTADYLYVRPTFSEAVSFLDQDATNIELFTDTFHQLDFGYESSFRVGGGYRLAHCGEQIRFLFTRFSGYATDVAPFGAPPAPNFVPYEVSPPPGGQTFIDGNVKLRAYDLEYAKTIPLGGQIDCGGCGPGGCGDGFYGCGDPCGDGGCPAWDITWSGGLRFAEARTSRTFTAVDAQGDVVTSAVGLMNFDGGGVRFGLEGRRYFGPGGCMSAYLKGDVSLLLGRIDLLAHRTVELTPELQNVTIQTLRHRQIVPVTEIETGLTGHITRNSTLTAGYLFAAWHDLGFRDTFDFATLMETSYDDANILGFDGFFARLEVAF